MASNKHATKEGFLTSSKGKKLYVRHWYEGCRETGKDPKVLLLMLHGLGEHCLNFSELAEFLNKQGIYVVCHDHVGHGQSEGSRVHVNNFQEYVDDCLLHAVKIRKELPNTPMFILGFSMGGTISILAARQRPDLFKGVILEAPGIILDSNRMPPTYKIWIGRVLSKIMPRLAVVEKSPSLLSSRDQETIKANESDPYRRRGKYKIRQVFALYDSMQEVNRYIPEIEWPFLVLHGESDGITSVRGSKLIFEKARSKDKQLKLFPEALHSLHRELEPVKTETFTAIANWIIERASQL